MAKDTITPPEQRIAVTAKEVKELKSIHNALHKLERAINPFESGIRGGIIPLENIPRFQKVWNQSTGEEFTNLDNASKGIKFLPPPYGWLEIIQLHVSFQDSLNELSSIDGSTDKAKETIRESVNGLIGICRQQMFQVDDKLNKQVEELNKQVEELNKQVEELTGFHGKRKNSAPNLRRIPFTKRWKDKLVALFMRSVRDTVTP